MLCSAFHKVRQFLSAWLYISPAVDRYGFVGSVKARYQAQPDNGQSRKLPCESQHPAGSL